MSKRRGVGLPGKIKLSANGKSFECQIHKDEEGRPRWFSTLKLVQCYSRNCTGMFVKGGKSKSKDNYKCEAEKQ
jgi:hypothetical protein